MLLKCCTVEISVKKKYETLIDSETLSFLRNFIDTDFLTIFKLKAFFNSLNEYPNYH